MTRDKDFKRLVRASMSRTGGRYTTVRAALLRPGREGDMVPVTCEVRLKTLTEEELRELGRTVVVKSQATEEQDDLLKTLLSGLKGSDKQPLLVLTEVGGARSLSIWCGPVEATAVAFAERNIETSRPLTHDLLRDVVAAMGEARQVRITELRDTTFLAELVVADTAGAERTVSCRPSDGIALAMRADIPILVAESLFAMATS